jgi:hypothetical protein
VFFFVSGPAEIGLVSSAVLHPAATETKKHLLSLLYSRAKAHKL